MNQERDCFSTVRRGFENSPFASNLALNFFLPLLEKFVEMEFTCPCEPTRNAWFVAGFFVIPAVLVFLLMIKITGCQCQMSRFSECVKTTVFSAVPAVVWLILLFYDGHYFACAKTHWSGSYVKVVEAAPHKLCKPDNSSISQEHIKEIREFFFQSQAIGLLLFGILTFGLGMYLMLSSQCCRREEDADEDPEEEEALRLRSGNQDTGV